MNHEANGIHESPGSHGFDSSQPLGIPVQQIDRSDIAALRDFERLLESSSLSRRPTADGWEPSNALVLSVAEQAGALPVERVAAGGPFTVGVEVLSHRLVGVLTDVHGTRLAEEQLLLADMSVDAVVSGTAAMVGSLRNLLRRHVVDPTMSLGIQLGGPVDADTGRVLFYKKIPGQERMQDAIQWADGIPLGQLLQDAIGLQTVVCNDADAYATFQLWFGVGRRTKRFALVLVREGVGGSLVLDGKLFDGPMELGNLSVFPESRRACDCGSVGCLETTGGIFGILETIHDYTGRKLNTIGAAAQLATDPDVGQKVCSAFNAAGHAHAKGIGVIINIARPEKLVLYAPTAMVDPSEAAASSFLEQVRQFPRYCHTVYGDCELVVEAIPPFAGAHGAALVALQRHAGIAPAPVPATEGDAR